VEDAEILVHGYRPNALANLGFDGETLRKLNPSLIDISLCAYGWNGPWKNRRGFDSLVQMSCGIAGYGMRMSGAQKPVPLPVQALDHATGYFMAAAALYALHRKRQHGEVLVARLSLARTAQLLMNNQRTTLHKHGCKLEPKDMNSAIENTGWGDAHRVRWPLEIAGREARWSHRAAALKSASATW
jgi:crotonobetainyl-CoA:carnitine CoA-transferase CaiB-like acyl-CoA transferase